MLDSRHLPRVSILSETSMEMVSCIFIVCGSFDKKLRKKASSEEEAFPRMKIQLITEVTEELPVVPD